jgi:hypothetical protein
MLKNSFNIQLVICNLKKEKFALASASYAKRVENKVPHFLLAYFLASSYATRSVKPIAQYRLYARIH